QLGKKADEKRVISRALAGGKPFIIHVDHVAHAREGKVGDGGWQNDVEMRMPEVATKGVDQGGGIVEEEIAVFKKTQQAEIGGQTGDKPAPTQRRISCPTDPASDVKIQQRSEKNQQNARDAPSEVKGDARHQQQPFLSIVAAHNLP